MGQGQPADRRRRASTRCSRDVRATSRRPRPLRPGPASPAPTPHYRLPVRVVTETPGTRCSPRTCSCARPTRPSSPHFEPSFTVLDAPELPGRPRRDGTADWRPSSCSTSPKRIILIGGTEYAGEIKKSIFTVMNYLLPAAGRAARCTARPTSAPTGDAALFFGLSGTGKTTLSADPDRGADRRRRARLERRRRLQLRGRLLRQGDPALARRPSRRSTTTTRRFGTILENVVHRPDDRAARPRRRLAHREHPRRLPDRLHRQRRARRAWAAIPRHVIFLTADAFGVLPPIARLTPRAGDVPLPVRLHRQGRRHRARRHRAAGDLLAPASARRSCRCTPPSTPSMLGEKLAQHGATCWLVNTGWTGGALRRRPAHEDRPHPRHGPRRARRRARRRRRPTPTRSSASQVPTRCPTSPRTSSHAAQHLEGRAPPTTPRRAKLAGMFRENFATYAAGVDPAVAAAGPASA